MPLYEYLCSACAHRFERIVKFSDPALKTCPQCGKDTIEQMISAPAVQFKGSGWYVTDYARKNSSPGSSSNKSEGSSDSTSSAKEGSGAGDSSAGPATSEKASGANSGSSPASSESANNGASSGTGKPADSK